MCELSTTLFTEPFLNRNFPFVRLNSIHLGTEYSQHSLSPGLQTRCWVMLSSWEVKSASFYPFRQRTSSRCDDTNNRQQKNQPRVKKKKKKKETAEGNMIILVQDFHSSFFLFLRGFGTAECLPGGSRCHGFEMEKVSAGLSIEKILHIDFMVSVGGEKVSVMRWQLLSTSVP